MSALIVIVYPNEAKAEEMRAKLFELQKEYLIEINDAVIAVKQDEGKVKLNQMLNTTAIGAASGGFWGLLIGAIFLMPIFGAALGAASGALSGALTDFGINDAFMKDLATRQRRAVRPDPQSDGRQGSRCHQRDRWSCAQDIARP
jgi:uncharacterized membrane protein